MKTTIHTTGEPPSYTINEPPYNTERRVAYDVGFALIVLLFILILIYTSYMCKRIKDPPSPPPPPTAIDSDSDDFQSVMLSTTLEDDIFSTFPTFVYSEGVGYDSRCTICLVDYELKDVIRSLPECGHLFHVGCVDTWLKVHPTCPVCRKSLLPPSSELS